MLKIKSTGAAIAAAGALACAQAAAAQTAAPDVTPGPPPATMPLVVTPVKPGLFMIVGDGGNSTVRVAGDGVILVDTKNPGDAIFGDLTDKIKGITPLPVKYVFITHVHNDHSGNTGRFVVSVPVIANDGEKALLATYTPSPGTGRSAAPSITYAKTYAVKLKGASAQAYHFNAAHTGGDTIVYFPDEKVICMGDELVAATPNIDYPNGGSALGWQKNLAEVDKLAFDYAIPGHGDAPISRADFEAYRKKWDTLIQRARDLVRAGTPKAQLVAKIRTDDIGWTINNAQWNQPARVDAFYAEMSK